MGKMSTGPSKRRPPEGSERPDEIDAWAKDVMPRVAPLVARIDELIRAELPDPRYAVKWGSAHYATPERGWVIQLAAYHKTVNVVFYGGADFDSPPPLGERDRSRYVKLDSLDEASEAQLRSWIAEAARIDGWT